MGGALLITWGDVRVREGIQRDRVAEGKQRFRAPGARQRLGDVVLGGVAVRVAQLREALGGTLTRQDGLEHGHAGAPRDLTDDLGALEMPLF
jgi:hypothetical protein